MGWTERTASGRWKGIYRGPDGKKHSRTKDRKQDAERWVRDNEIEKDRGTWVPPEIRNVTFEPYFRQFLSQKVRRPATLDLYERLARNHILPTFGHRILAHVQQEDVLAWLADLELRGIGASTRAAAFRLLRAVFHAALIGRKVTWVPTNGVQPPTVTERERRHLEPEQVERLASAFPDRYQALIYTMGYCGLRLGEATGLKIDDLDMLRRRLSVVRTASQVAGKVVEGPPKTPESKRTIAIPAFVRDLLAAHIARFPIEGGYVFGGDNGRQLHPNIFRKHQWSRAVRESGLGPLTPHDLRRTTAAILVKGGATIQEIAQYLGHKNAAITSELYAGILDSVATDAADRMDATYRAAQGRGS